MPDESTGGADKPGDLQFDKAEFSADAKANPATQCAACSRPLPGSYFEINSKVVCPTCKDMLIASLTGGSGFARFIRAAILGVLAAIASSLLYYGIRAATGYEFGLVAIVVGLLVGAAVRKGCNRRGGWLYQLLAVFLTYASITGTYAPYILHGIAESVEERGTAHAEPAAPADDDLAEDPATSMTLPARTDIHTTALATQSTVSRTTVTAETDGADSADFQHLSGAQKALTLTLALSALAALILVVPLLAMKSSPIMILIILFGLYEAWRLNKRPVVTVTGPYQLAPAPPAEPGA